MIEWVVEKLWTLITNLFSIIANVLIYIINTILRFLITLLDTLLPAIGLPDEFMAALDTAITAIINLINAAGYFIPLQTVVMCIGLVFAIDAGILAIRLGMWIIKLIRG
ncbi:MAG: hypothetical protein N2645_06895 [Clostridia bacterium]|nr:hypothetical protein [Clostridia bacterium]